MYKMLDTVFYPVLIINLCYFRFFSWENTPDLFNFSGKDLKIPGKSLNRWDVLYKSYYFNSNFGRMVLIFLLG